MNMFKFKYNG
jgi:group I intron endonuclease